MTKRLRKTFLTFSKPGVSKFSPAEKKNEFVEFVYLYVINYDKLFVRTVCQFQICRILVVLTYLIYNVLPPGWF